MSFEGTFQVLCPNGHADMFDVYMMEPEDWMCEVCGEPCAWWNLIDETNGVNEDCYVKLEVEEEEECTCEKCGNVHHTKTIRYKIPDAGHKK